MDLHVALKLGRQAVALGVETLDLALIHEQALVSHVLTARTPIVRERIIKWARSFFAEAIIPMEETHRSAMEANVHLSRLNQELSRRTVNLAASSLLLKKQIARRLVVEETLRKSKQHTIQLLQQSRRLQEQLRHLSRRILSTQEEERKRISRELHDVIAQMLTGINVRLAILKVAATANTKGISKKIAHTQRLVEKSVDIVNRFARELRPAALDDLGLIPALHTFMKTFMKETGIRVRATAFAGVEELSSAKRTALYRVAQEALTNVARHARATRVDVSIQRQANAVCMQIQDNGESFDVERALHSKKAGRLGLLGMRERMEMLGGCFEIKSSPGKGTAIKVRLPFRNGTKERCRP
jgi:signal transduction histidine kinase